MPGAMVSDFVPQSQDTPTSEAALIKLRDLKNANTLSQKRLNERIAEAVKLITNTASQINDRGHEARVEHQKKKRRLAESKGDVDAEDDEQFDSLQGKVDSTTRKLDLGVRKMIDDRNWLDSVPDALKHVIQKSDPASRREAQQTQLTIDGEGPDDDDHINTNVQGNNVTDQPDASENPSVILHAAFSMHESLWNTKSLTQRYANDNDYIGYYRMVYDANHPGDNAPPAPHSSLWFAAEEGRAATTVSRGSQQQRHRRRRRPNSSNEIESTPNMIDLQSSESASDEPGFEIQRERIRITCPVTLLPFREPLASTKCPHAFEKSAIQSMLDTSPDHVALTPTQTEELSQLNPRDRSRRERELRIPVIRCPECTVPLTAKDLRPDPVLLRRVNRALEKKRREAEADRRRAGGAAPIVDTDDDDDDADDNHSDNDEQENRPRASQRTRREILELGSSPPRSVRVSGSARKAIKDEGRRDVSRVPQTQVTQDFGSDDDDDDDDDGDIDMDD